MEIKVDEKNMSMERENAEMATEVFNHYGLELQLVKLIEEMGEATQATAKCLLNRTPQDIANKTLPDNVVEEMADVFLLMKQIVFLTRLNDRVTKIQHEKLKRQLKRIKKEKEGAADGEENKD